MSRVLQLCITERELKKMFIGGVSMKLRNLRNKYWNQSRWKGSPNTEKLLFGSQLYYIRAGLYSVNSVKSSLGHKLIVGLYPLRLSNRFEFFPKFFQKGGIWFPPVNDDHCLLLLFLDYHGYSKHIANSPFESLLYYT